MSENFNHIDLDLLTRYFSGECTSEEETIVLHWKAESEENTRHFNELQEVWTTMGKTSPNRNIDVDAEWEKHTREFIPSVEKPGKTAFLNTTLRIAASVIIILGLSYTGWNFLSKKSVQTNLAETRQISLPDGSRVTLNEGSKITYQENYGKKFRTVKLNGEAYFEVVKNPSKPFIIKLNGAEVKVLGTSFNVKAYENQEKIEVTVAEGKVSVYKKGLESEQTIITKGEQAVYQKQAEVIQKQQNTDRNFIAWKTHSLVFENDNLSTIIKTLNAVYHVEFVLENPQLNNCTVTTSFENRDLTSVLKVLQLTLDISFEEKDGKIIIKGKGC